MAKSLVIVESPGKVKAINKYLGKNYVVKASLGHIKDLPKRDLAVDVENGFKPKYEVIEGKKKLMQELRDAAIANRRTVTACSALTRDYRDLLREYVPTAFFVELDGPVDVVSERVLSRHHQYMSASLLQSQYATLEPLEPDERGLRIDATLGVEEIVAVVERALIGRSPL